MSRPRHLRLPDGDGCDDASCAQPGHDSSDDELGKGECRAHQDSAHAGDDCGSKDSTATTEDVSKKRACERAERSTQRVQSHNGA